jgi:hypothetical protein
MMSQVTPNKCRNQNVLLVLTFKVFTSAMLTPLGEKFLKTHIFKRRVLQVGIKAMV